MRIFSRVWSDIQRGENIDPYLAVAVAVITGIAALLGWGTTDQVAAVAVLALLAFSMLQSRYRFEQSIIHLIPKPR